MSRNSRAYFLRVWLLFIVEDVVTYMSLININLLDNTLTYIKTLQYLCNNKLQWKKAQWNHGQPTIVIIVIDGMLNCSTKLAKSITKGQEILGPSWNYSRFACLRFPSCSMAPQFICAFYGIVEYINISILLYIPFSNSKYSKQKAL